MAVLFAASDMINVGTPVSLDNISQYSIAMWARTTDEANYQLFTNKDNMATAGYYLCLMTGSHNIEWIYRWSGNDGNWNWTSVFDHNGAWHHVVCSYDRNSTGYDPKLYVNGVDKGAPTEIGTPTGSPMSEAGIALCVGGRPPGSGSWRGSLADCRIYPRLLSQPNAAKLAGGFHGSLGGEIMWHGMCTAEGISVWEGATLVQDVNYLYDWSPNDNEGNPIHNPVGELEECGRKPGGDSLVWMG